MANSREFKATLGKWAAKAGSGLEALARQSAQELAERVVLATPVDTGFLRGSFQPSIGEPQAAKGQSDKSGSVALSSVSLAIAEMRLGDRFFLTNNADYALHVEYGTSRMAGRFYVGDNVKAWSSIVESVARQVRLDQR